MPESLQHVLSRLLNRPLTTISLSDGSKLVRFWINPRQWDLETTYNQFIGPTRSGFGIFEYGILPGTVEIDGFTGNAGLDGPGGLYDLEQFRPMQGRPRKLLTMTYPNRTKRIMHVKLVTMSDNISQDMHLYYQYKMQFNLVGRTQQPPAIRLSGRNPLNVVLPVGG